MSRKRTSTEVQTRIQQRYEDTALLIYRQQRVDKQNNLSLNELSLQTRHAFEYIDEAAQLRDRPAAPPRQQHTQSQICVIL